MTSESSENKLEDDIDASQRSFVSEDLPDTIENKFKVLKKIGEGQTSTVFLVNHLFLNNQLAIKLFRDKYWENEKRFTRAQREAQTLASIEHVNVVKVFDFGVTQDGAPYIVQEFVNGTNLKELVQRDGALGETRSLRLIKQIAQGLSCLHENRVLHRDIKSQNIIIDESVASNIERVKLIDLGLARPKHSGAIQSLTQSGRHIGSPYYMSPEVCQGDEIDNRSDIYSLGCVMYELLSGKLPFRSDSALKTLEMHINEKPIPLTEYGINPKLDAIVQKCLAKNKEDRYSNCKKLMHDLELISSPKKLKFRLSRSLTGLMLLLLPLAFLGTLVISKVNNKNSTTSMTDKNQVKPLVSSGKELDRYIEETTRANMLSRLGVNTKSVKLFKQALNSAYKSNASDIEICILAEEYTHSLILNNNFGAVNHVYGKVGKSLERILKEVEEDPTYSKKLATVPLLYYNASIAALAEREYFASSHRIENALKLLVKHPDRVVLTPYFNIEKSKSLTKTRSAEEGLLLLEKTKSKIAAMLGKQHFLYIRALVTESRIYETDKNYAMALNSLDDALRRCRHNTARIDTSFLIRRRREIAKQLAKTRTTSQKSVK